MCMTATARSTASFVLAAALPCFAVSKEIIQLQTQVQALQDQVSRMQQSIDMNMGAVRNLIEAQGRHDLPAILACFGMEPTLEFVGGPRHIGAERVGQIYSDLLRAFPDLVIEVMAEHVADRSVVIEMVLQGNHRQQWLGMAPRGRPLSLPVCHVFLFDKRDQISALRIYLDRNLAIVQLTSGLLR